MGSPWEELWRSARGSGSHSRLPKVTVAHGVLTSHCPQVDVLDRLGGGPQGQSARAAGEGLDGRLTPRHLCHLQDGAVAQWAEPGHPSGAPLLGGCLLRPHRDHTAQRHRPEGGQARTCVGVFPCALLGHVCVWMCGHLCAQACVPGHVPLRTCGVCFSVPCVLRVVLPEGRLCESVSGAACCLRA